MLLGVHANDMTCFEENKLPNLEKHWKKGKFAMDKGKKIQETSLKRSDYTCWDYHCGTLISLIVMYSSIIDLLEIIKEDGLNANQRAKANSLLDLIQTLDFCFHFTFDENYTRDYKLDITSIAKERSRYYQCHEFG